MHNYTYSHSMLTNIHTNIVLCILYFVYKNIIEKQCLNLRLTNDFDCSFHGLRGGRHLRHHRAVLGLGGGQRHRAGHPVVPADPLPGLQQPEDALPEQQHLLRRHADRHARVEPVRRLRGARLRLPRPQRQPPQLVVRPRRHRRRPPLLRLRALLRRRRLPAQAEAER